MALVRVLTEDEVRDGYTDGAGFHKGAKEIVAHEKSQVLLAEYLSIILLDSV